MLSSIGFLSLVPMFDGFLGISSPALDSLSEVVWNNMYHILFRSPHEPTSALELSLATSTTLMFLLVKVVSVSSDAEANI